jgi:hypothetical protein
MDKSVAIQEHTREKSTREISSVIICSTEDKVVLGMITVIY